MRRPEPITLTRESVQLEPMAPGHAADLARAAQDGELWKLRVTSVPFPGDEAKYIATALQGQSDGHMLPFVVRDLRSGQIMGSTRYHDIVIAVERVEIGYTWYARQAQRSHVNTSCKLLLMSHAFDSLGAKLVGWRTDILNLASQAAIERLGARKDGVIRHHALRPDGSVRDTVMYSVTIDEWPAVCEALERRLARPR